MQNMQSKKEAWKDEVLSSVKIAVEMAGSSHALGRHLDTKYQTILGWLRGATPSDPKMEKLEQFLAKNGKAKPKKVKKQ